MYMQNEKYMNSLRIVGMVSVHEKLQFRILWGVIILEIMQIQVADLIVLFFFFSIKVL